MTIQDLKSKAALKSFSSGPAQGLEVTGDEA